MKLQSFVEGKWQEGKGSEKILVDASTGEKIAVASADGIDIESAYHYARTKGNPSLRKLTFRERGILLKKLAMHLLGLKDKFYTVSFKTGATKSDSWIDIEGGIGNLFSYASLRRQFQDSPYYVEGESIDLSRGGPFMGHHIMVPKEGVAVHINAFNFPVWGMLEKCAVNWLAGVPAIVKPATLTSYLTEAVVREIINSKILPEGCIQLICGNARNILDFANYQDVITFTGSASTGFALRSHPNIIKESIPFNMEADSLNCIVLGEDVKVGSDEFQIFVKEVRREITAKCGQKCTAIRRIFVPENLMDDVQLALSQTLSATTIGDPRVEGVKMGALAGIEQVDEVKQKIKELLRSSQMVYGNLEDFNILGGNKEKGAFLPPVLLRNDRPFDASEVHNVEAFGPVSTLMPYREIEEAIALSKLGKGSLCSSIVTGNDQIAKSYVLGAATHHGRILILNKESAGSSTGHGSPLPMLVHGGPGRAGGGEEMGGIRGVKHYLQRCAIQGSSSTLTEVTGIYQQGGRYKDPGVHVFKKHFEDLQIGETVITHKRTITEYDIVQFANVSWDHFYAHTDVTSLDGTTFDQRVAHGYFILSAAAGLFVDPAKGPVLLNYGIENGRFIKPVYPGTTIGVRLTVKEKSDQETKDENDIPKGIVKFFVDVYDETGDSVAIATILTMVKKRNG